MMAVQEVRDWLDSLAEDAEVYIHDDGLTLCAREGHDNDCDVHAYLELGGEPYDEEITDAS